MKVGIARLKRVIIMLVVISTHYCFAVCPPLSLHANSPQDCSQRIKKYKRATTSCYCLPARGDALAYNIGRDVVSLFAHLWDWDTLKIIVGLFPVFIAARMIDQPLQDNFFCHGCHRNKNQLPNWCHQSLRGLAVPIAVGSLAFLSKDYELHYTGWMLWLGLPFLVFGKDVIKNFDADCCLRPWHEDFCKNHKRCMGGFPSGHMAQAVYMAVLFGQRYGPAAAIPLGVYAVALGAVFLNCNRHYLSQLVAGAGLGAIFAVAANKVIDHRLKEKLSCNLSCDSAGSPGVQVSWKF